MDAKTALGWLIVIAAVAIAAATAGGGGGGGGSADQAGRLAVRPGQTVAAQVTRVVDGDTVRVRAPGAATETVRYIGVDTPESVKPDTPVECYGKEASRRNAELVSEQSVRLVVGAEPRDRYGRLLAYVYRARDGRFVNEALAAEGFARALTIPPNDRFQGLFERRVSAAKQARKGQWGAC
ncbi:Thermonuclease [Paraconexibacter sp. AEG42_29]|uniref:Thermonuclease n=1 Tax=Paraconexibacter sp. AEG42_29 TaxID=2997339 RepID=A0AAU7B0L0_9ACTN